MLCLFTWNALFAKIEPAQLQLQLKLVFLFNSPVSQPTKYHKSFLACLKTDKSYKNAVIPV